MSNLVYIKLFGEMDGVTLSRLGYTNIQSHLRSAIPLKHRIPIKKIDSHEPHPPYVSMFSDPRHTIAKLNVGSGFVNKSQHGGEVWAFNKPQKPIKVWFIVILF